MIENHTNSGDTRSPMNELFLSIDRISSHSSLRSVKILKSGRGIIPTIRSFSLLLCTFTLIINGLRLGFIYLFPKIYPSLIQSSLNLCIIESFFLHVLTCFHLHLIIFLRLYWYYCFLCEKYWPTKSYCRILSMFLLIFIFLCLLTLPSTSNEWSSVTYDEISQICIVNYLFNYSYTFFTVSFTCFIPFMLIIISHKLQMNAIENHTSKYISNDENLNLSRQKTQFQYCSYAILIWSFLNILLLIILHVPTQNAQIRTVIYYIELFSFLLDPIIFIVIFYSLSIITLLPSKNEIYYI
ncbi:unnamed protein product [Rotaria socialis]|uniref:G-protein coupled receptors family 1 profile domain-containing protein n=1 Tax=Rotaria socialis TaxID=392032 RepID=A0A818PPE9_9BILA|nr:unnamed protein product [Rotaria socialis]